MATKESGPSLHSYDDVTIIGENVQSTVRVVSELGGIFNVSHLLNHDFCSLIQWTGSFVRLARQTSGTGAGPIRTRVHSEVYDSKI